MKFILFANIVALSACASLDTEIQEHLEAERDFHAQQSYFDDLYSTYDPEYISDCLYYEELVCEFE